MIILISGTTHTGKTALSQRLMEKYKNKKEYGRKNVYV